VRRTLSAPTATYFSPRNESPERSPQHTPYRGARNKGKHCGWNAVEVERKPALSLLLSHGVGCCEIMQNTGGASGDKRGHRRKPVAMDWPGWRTSGSLRSVCGAAGLLREWVLHRPKSRRHKHGTRKRERAKWALPVLSNLFNSTSFTFAIGWEVPFIWADRLTLGQLAFCLGSQSQLRRVLLLAPSLASGPDRRNEGLITRGVCVSSRPSSCHLSSRAEIGSDENLAPRSGPGPIRSSQAHVIGLRRRDLDHDVIIYHRGLRGPTLSARVFFFYP
jgi:hypothetical protein